VDEAIEEHRRATEVNPREPRHFMNLAGTLYTHGDFEEAARAARAALDLNPMHAKALNILNSVQPIQEASDERLPLLLKHAAAVDQLSIEDRTLSHFDLYRAFNKLKRTDEAWEHLERGNELALEDMKTKARGTQEMQVFNIEAFAFSTRMIKTTFTRAVVDELRAAADALFLQGGLSHLAPFTRDPSGAPIFIIGAYRSGSTLVEQILSSHSQVHGAGENTAMSPTIFAASTRSKADYPTGFIAAGRRDPTWFEQIGAEYVQTMRASAQVAKSGKARWVDKNLGNLRSAAVVALALPNAKFIHTVRSPVATCFSMYTQHFTQGGPAGRWFTCSQETLREHYKALHELARHWDEVLPAHQLLTVRYEDVVNNQEEMTRRIIDFVGLEWEDQCLQFHKTERAVATASLSQVRQPMYNSSLDSWRKYEHRLATLTEGLAGLHEVEWASSKWPRER